MKVLFSVLFVLMACKSYSQNLASISEQPRPKYSAKDSVVSDQINQTIKLYGKVEFEVNGLDVKADEVFFGSKEPSGHCKRIK